MDSKHALDNPLQPLPFNQPFRLAETVKVYYGLTKPGIIYGNAITAAAGFFLATNLMANQGGIHFGTFINTLLGTSLIIACACVINNYIDRGIDAKMDRTKKRATVSGRVSGRAALIYATALGITGFSLLTLFVNMLTVIVGLTGLLFYVVFYGLAKRRSIYGTEIGSISGSMPIVAGYTAATGRLDMATLLLFLVLTFWQMPHFYAIAMYRLKDYAAAGLPVLPYKKGMRQTKIRMLTYIIAFGLAAGSLGVFGYTGYTYLVVVMALTCTWLWRGRNGFKTVTDAGSAAWARMMFGFSLIVLLSFSLGISLDRWLP